METQDIGFGEKLLAALGNFESRGFGAPDACNGTKQACLHVGGAKSKEAVSLDRRGKRIGAPFVGGVPLLPVYRGELQGRSLGAAVEAFDDQGNYLAAILTFYAFLSIFPALLSASDKLAQVILAAPRIRAWLGES